MGFVGALATGPNHRGRRASWHGRHERRRYVGRWRMEQTSSSASSSAEDGRQLQGEVPHVNVEPEDGAGGSSSRRSRARKFLSFMKTLTHPILWRERVKIVVMCFVAFVVTNMDRVNISFVMIPLSRYHNWRPVTVGLIQSAFFWGYLLTQIPGGYLANRYGAKYVFAVGFFTWSTMTLLFPYFTDKSLILMLISRCLIGMGEGMILPAMSQMVSTWIRTTERSRSLGFIYSGIYLGSILGLTISPNLTMSIGWQYVFYFFGGVGLLWTLVWVMFVGASPDSCRSISKQELRYIRAGMDSPTTVSAKVWTESRTCWTLLPVWPDRLKTSAWLSRASNLLARLACHGARSSPRVRFGRCWSHTFA